MTSQYSLRVTPEQAKEMPMVDLAFEILKSSNVTYYYRDLMSEIAKIKALSDDQKMNVIAQLYTEINIDGRFACVGQNQWGLKRWYPVEKSEDNVGGTQHPRIINDIDDDDDYFTEEDFDTFEEAEEFAAVEEEEEEFFEDEEIDEEPLDDVELEDSEDDAADDDIDGLEEEEFLIEDDEEEEEK